MHRSDLRRPSRTRRAASAAALAGLALALAACEERAASPLPARAPVSTDDLLESERNTIEVFRRVSGSVVYVANAKARRGDFFFESGQLPQGEGSGFIFDERGHIVTNYHVVHGGERFSVSLSDGTTYDAVLIGVAPRKDLAVLRIDADRPLQPVEFGDSQSLMVGQMVLAIGNPFGLDSSLSTGVISALGREIESVAGTRIEDVIQTDASINPGNSGGPLLDSRGRVIGVTTAIYGTRGGSAGIAFAVPSATVARLVPELIEHGRVRWAGLGVQVMPDHIAAQWGILGVLVREVLPQSPAEKAGMHSMRVDRLGNLREVDVITHIDGHATVRVIDLVDLLDDYEPGDTVTVTFDRGEQTFEVQVELAEVS